jgi:hypothetical protein
MERTGMTAPGSRIAIQDVEFSEHPGFDALLASLQPEDDETPDSIEARGILPEFPREVVLDEETKVVELEAYWLTLPEIQGSKVTMTVTRQTSDESSASVTIVGFGGGPTFTFSIKDELSFEVQETCRVLLRAPATFRKMQMRQGDRVWKPDYVRLGSIDFDNLEWEVTPADPPDVSGWGKPVTTTRFTIAVPNATGIRTLTVNAGTAFETKLEVSLKKLGLEASLSTKMAYERELSFANELPGGHQYLAARYNGFPAYIWQIES